MKHLTIGAADGTSIQQEGGDGGVCCANPVGAIYNDFLCIKPDLTPQEFIGLLKDTSDELKVNEIYCGRLLNAESAAQKLIENKSQEN